MAHRHVRLVNTLVGYEWQCEAGQFDQPIGCERHRDHHWCEFCLGFYGVPHDGIHEYPTAHPRGAGRCACRPCKKAAADGREPSPPWSRHLRLVPPHP